MSSGGITFLDEILGWKGLENNFLTIILPVIDNERSFCFRTLLQKRLILKGLKSCRAMQVMEMCP